MGGSVSLCCRVGTEFDTMMEAAKTGDVAAIRNLTQDKPYLAHTRKPTFGYSSLPVLEVAKHGSVECMQLLLAKGADVNTRNQFGQSPVMLASQRGNLELVLVLIQHKAILTQNDCAGLCSLHHAALNGSAEVIDALIGGFPPGFKSLFDRNKMPDIVSGSGCTPLMLAAFHGHTAAVKVLLRHGASPFLGMSMVSLDHLSNSLFQLGEGSNALHMAASQGHTPVVMELLQAGTKPEQMRLMQVRNLNGWNAWMVARLKGHVECAEFLKNVLQHNVDMAAWVKRVAQVSRDLKESLTRAALPHSTAAGMMPPSSTSPDPPRCHPEGRRCDPQAGSAVGSDGSGQECGAGPTRVLSDDGVSVSCGDDRDDPAGGAGSPRATAAVATLSLGGQELNVLKSDFHHLPIACSGQSGPSSECSASLGPATPRTPRTVDVGGSWHGSSGSGTSGGTEDCGICFSQQAVSVLIMPCRHAICSRCAEIVCRPPKQTTVDQVMAKSVHPQCPFCRGDIKGFCSRSPKAASFGEVPSNSISPHAA